jgi:hypothetical protein
MSEQTVEGYDKHLEDENVKIANRIAMERMVRIDETARKLKENNGEISIRLRIPIGETDNAFGEKEVMYKDGEYETKSYKFRNIVTNDWNLYTLKRAELQNENVKPIEQIDQNKIAELNSKIYEYLALKYLGVPHNEYVRAEWDDVKLAVETCNHITESAHISFAETEPQIKPSKPRLKVKPMIDQTTITLNALTRDEPQKEDSSSKKSYDYEG